MHSGGTRMRFMVTTKRRDRKARTFKYAACLACLFSVGLALDAGAAQVSSGTWAPASSMAQARAGASAALLPDGRILITGGDDADRPSASAELYDVSADWFAAAAPMPVARTRHVSVVL